MTRQGKAFISLKGTRAEMDKRCKLIRGDEFSLEIYMRSRSSVTSHRLGITVESLLVDVRAGCSRIWFGGDVK